MSDTSCACASSGSKTSCTATSNTSSAIQNGKGDAPRNISQKFRSNYDQINWGGSSRRKS